MILAIVITVTDLLELLTDLKVDVVLPLATCVVEAPTDRSTPRFTSDHLNNNIE